MSSFRYARNYVGPVKACLLDWSGTTVDKYVLAPAVIFVEVFKKFKVMNTQNSNNVHLSCTHQHPERSHHTCIF